MIRTRRVLSVLFSISVLGLALLVWTQKQAIYDWYKLQGYNPPNAVAQLATDTTMVSSARRLFYVHRPNIDDKIDFNQHCPTQEQTIILGCYIKNHSIYIFNVTDNRLNGVREVTAAHELLHAAYDRLSDDELKSVSSLLKQAYNELDNERIKKNIAAYRRAGADILNELHSILGTEVRNLPEELDNYYSRYFNNRLRVVELSENYESNFTNIKQQAVKLEAKIKRLQVQINSLGAELDSSRSQLEAQRSEVDSPAEADSFNARVESYNNALARLNLMIQEHNTLVKQHRKLVTEQNQLFEAIDARSSTL
ncbi:MAG TPA: hypothetical protein VJJ78_04055 [Candidatus Saccharimonadales bacterium]|nr:hypothetical protein [Candidatus Saccharimonadales bacterium]